MSEMFQTVFGLARSNSHPDIVHQHEAMRARATAQNPKYFFVERPNRLHLIGTLDGKLYDVIVVNSHVDGLCEVSSFMPKDGTEKSVKQWLNKKNGRFVNHQYAKHWLGV